LNRDGFEGVRQAREALAASSISQLVQRDRLYSQDKLAELWGVSRKTLARWRIKGVRVAGSSERVKLMALTIGGRRRVRGVDAIAFVRLLTAADALAPVSQPTRPPRRRHDQVDAALDAAGF
jgi:hypothetical protein